MISRRVRSYSSFVNEGREFLGAPRLIDPSAFPRTVCVIGSQTKSCEVASVISSWPKPLKPFANLLESEAAPATPQRPRGLARAASPPRAVRRCSSRAAHPQMNAGRVARKRLS
jgi:hypothetical protein